MLPSFACGSAPVSSDPLGVTNMDNVKHLGIHPDARRRNRLGRFAAMCYVTDRWLQFDEGSQDVPDMGDMIRVSVMTNAGNGPRKLCELMVSREDILGALAQVRTTRPP